MFFNLDDLPSFQIRITSYYTEFYNNLSKNESLGKQ